MAWNPNIPTVTNRVQDDLDAIRGNFRHLDPLVQIVNELQTVSGLAPITDDLQAVSGLAPITDDLQAVSGLAPITDDLQAVSGLAPYITALVSSRVVDHNLDVPNPPNGWYVRWANGLQMCYFLRVSSGRSITAAFGALFSDTHAQQWTFPAAFSVAPLTLGMVQKDATAHPYLKAVESATNSFTYVAIAPQSGTFALEENLFAIGVWK